MKERKASKVSSNYLQQSKSSNIPFDKAEEDEEKESKIDRQIKIGLAVKEESNASSRC